MATHEILKKLRESKKLNKKQLSKEVDIPYTTYCNYESGYREPDSNTYKKISKFYNVSIDYLVGNTDIEESADMESILQSIKDRPEMHTLFLKTAKASKEDVLKAIKMLDIFQEENHDL